MENKNKGSRLKNIMKGFTHKGLVASIVAVALGGVALLSQNTVDRDNITLSNHEQIILYKLKRGSIRTNFSFNSYNLSVHDTNNDGIADYYHDYSSGASKIWKRNYFPDSLQKLYSEVYQLSKFHKEKK